jgi:hypothetical protein
VSTEVDRPESSSWRTAEQIHKFKSELGDWQMHRHYEMAMYEIWKDNLQFQAISQPGSRTLHEGRSASRLSSTLACIPDCQ